MTWLRARKGWCAHIALFALALQFVASFGHVHRNDSVAFRAAAVQIVVDGHLAGQDSAALTSRDADSDIGDAIGGVCQICVALALASVGTIDAPLSLAHPLNFAEAEFGGLARAQLATPPAASFWSRGPPTA